MASKIGKKGNPITAFESSTQQLEEIIKILESDSTTLEQSLETFEQGIKLARAAQQSLKEAEQKVQLLLVGDDGPALKDFEEPG